MKRPARLLLIGTTGALAVALALRHARRPPAAEELVVPAPPGWWTIDVRGSSALAADERARQLSLPYVSGGARAQGAAGTRVLRPDLVAPGHNLYVSAHGPEAYLVDVDGKVLWRWRYPFEKAFPEKSPTKETGFWRRARLLPGGDLLVLVQGGGIFRLDRDSRLLWRSRVSAYNDLVPTPDGGALTLVKEARRRPELFGGAELLEDFLVQLDASGREVRRVSILGALLSSPWSAWVATGGGPPDLLHANTVQPLDGAFADLHPAFAAGNVLLSLREVDALVVLEPARGEIVWALRGAWKRQHQPLLLPPGELVLFDNRGGPGGTTRLLGVDPLDGTVRWQFPAAGEPPLRSEQAGSVQALPGGNLLVVESAAGRAYEITAALEPVWEFASPHRAGEHRELVAYLFDVLRVPPADWLPAAAEAPR